MKIFNKLFFKILVFRGCLKIKQVNSDNKDTSVNNSIVLIVTDKDSVNKIMEIVNGKKM